MDLGIKGRRAIVCAASKGLGRACAEALAREGVALVINARHAEALEATAAAIRAETGVPVEAVAADITTEEGRRAVLARCPDPDILITNAGGPPPGDSRKLTREQWLAALEANMLTPIALIQAVLEGMCARRFGRIVNITSASVKSPIRNLGLSNGARAGLTGFIGGLAREVASFGVVINNLLPGPFLTERLARTMEDQARAAGRSVEEEIARRAAAIPAGRIGDPAEFGAICAFLCSQHVGYLIGQNILVDGGGFNASFG
jgi:3-oxoacyl-[acyl-carrier protein] reductase